MLSVEYLTDQKTNRHSQDVERERERMRVEQDSRNKRELGNHDDDDRDDNEEGGGGLGLVMLSSVMVRGTTLGLQKRKTSRNMEGRKEGRMRKKRRGEIIYEDRLARGRK